MSDVRRSRLTNECVSNLKKMLKSPALDFDQPLPGVIIDEKIINKQNANKLSSLLCWSLLLANVYVQLSKRSQDHHIPNIFVCRCFADAFARLEQQGAKYRSSCERPLVTLVTGSLYLVGSALTFAQSKGARI